MGTAILFSFQKESTPDNTLPAGHRAQVIQFLGTVRTVPAAPEKPKQRKRGNTQEADQRQSLYAKINIALRGKNGEPGLFAKLEHFDEDFYRDQLNGWYNLQERFGRISAADLEVRELEQVVKWLSGLGWQAKKGRHRRSAPKTLTNDSTGMSREDKMGKIEAMLAEKGRVEGSDMPWGYAVAILKRQTSKEWDGPYTCFDDERVTPAHLDAVIAALYKDAKRRGRRRR